VPHKVAFVDCFAAVVGGGASGDLVGANLQPVGQLVLLLFEPNSETVVPDAAIGSALNALCPASLVIHSRLPVMSR
jgi:hypothetical protein